MPKISPDTIHRINALQNQIWQSVTQVVTDASEAPITFSSPITSSEQTAELYAELGTPMLIIQFAFAARPENAQVVLLPQETFSSWASYLKGELVPEADESIVADVRASLEAIVQGLCVGTSLIRGEPVVASGLVVRYQVFNFPPNLQNSDEQLRTQVAISGDGLSGTAIWLMDDATAQFVLSSKEEQDEEDSSFLEVERNPNFGNEGRILDDTAGLDLLMDIPLEISVELGRVKMLVKDIVELGTGSIIEIDKAAGEPVDVMVNGRLVARGEVVVIEDNFGVRITEILNAHERLQRLSEVA
jgi:flagellar motor switch protein FliN